MSRIRTAFENGKAFIPLLPAEIRSGDDSSSCPGCGEERGRSDRTWILFSDPTAGRTGDTGSKSARSFRRHQTDHIFEFVRGCEDISIPMVFMTYANVASLRCREIHFHLRGNRYR